MLMHIRYSPEKYVIAYRRERQYVKTYRPNRTLPRHLAHIRTNRIPPILITLRAGALKSAAEGVVVPFGLSFGQLDSAVSSISNTSAGLETL